MKTKNKSLLYFALILACILAFCGALVLSVFTAEKVAFADDTYTFNQYIQNGFTPSIGSDSPWEIYNTTYTDSVTQNEFYSWVNGNSSSSGYGAIQYNVSSFLNTQHVYLLRVNIYYDRDGEISITLPHGPTHQRQLDALVNNTVYLEEILFTYLPSTSFGDYLRFSCNTLMKSFGISNVEFIDLTLLNFSSAPQLPDKVWYIELFGDLYHPYTINTPLSDIKSYPLDESYHNGYLSGVEVGYNDGFTDGHEQGYTDGYNQGVEVSYDVGYNAGYIDGVSASTNNSFVCQESNFVPSPGYPLFENVIGNYWSIYGITDDENYLSLNKGYLDIFNLSYNDLLNTQPSFSWLLPTASVTNGVLSYGRYLYTSIFVGFQDGALYLSDSSSPSDPWQDYHVYMEMQEHHTLIYTSFFPAVAQNSSAVPNFYLGSGIDIFALEFYLDDISATIYSNGFNKGFALANDTVTQSSASYSAGYNHGVESAGNYTFPSIISAAIDVPVQTARSLLNFDVFGVNLNTFVLSLLSFGVVVGIIKLILGR